MNELKGLVINSIDYKEKSKIVYLYTPYGHDSIKANKSKDLSSGLLGFTTTLNEVSFIKSNGKLPTLLEYHLIESHYELTKSIDKLDSIFIILEVIRNIPIDSNHSKIYDYVIATINDLSKYDSKKVLSIFLIKMLYTFGVTPNLKSCIKCGSTDIKFLSILQGECYCSNCTSNNNIDKYRIWYEYYYDKKNIDEYTNIDFDNLLNDIYIYYNNHVHINLIKKDFKN